MRVCPPGFVLPCLPTKAQQPPSGEAWLHEIKHDGFRIIARKAGDKLRLCSRPGNDLTYRFRPIVEALAKLRSRSCIIDGEAVGCDDEGMPSFDRIRYRRHDASVFLYAFDLIELNGDDLRRDPLEVRKATLASVLTKAAPGLRVNEHIEPTAPLCSRTPARWASKASCRSGSTHPTAAAARPTGSRARTRRAKR
jgi:ATP-dependent DNA ligase